MACAAPCSTMAERSARFHGRAVVRVALSDLAHGWRSTLCLVAGVAVALAPLLLLYGLNFGFVTGLIEQLRADPRTREIRPVGQYELDAAWFEALQSREDVAFLLPRTRYLASQTVVRGDGRAGPVDAELVPSGAGDPLVATGRPPESVSEVVLTRSLAQAVAREPGDAVELQIIRRVGEERQSVRHEVTVVGVVPRALFERDAVLAAPGLLDAVERWREGQAVPLLGWPGVEAAAERRSFASFRMYARDVRDVPALRDLLVADGLDVRTRGESIDTALAIERGLGWVFLIVAALASAGFLLTMGLHLAAMIVEKARELSVMRVLGMTGGELSAIPTLQGAVIAGSGALAAGLAVKLAQAPINHRLDGLAGFTGDLSRLQWDHVLVALIVSVAAGALAGSVAGWRAARLEPTEGLRRD